MGNRQHIEQRNSRIIEAYRQGVSIAGLMERFDMTRPAVKSVLYRYRKSQSLVRPQSELTKEEREVRNAEILRRHDAGERPCEIHRAMGISKNIVLGLLHRVA